MVVLKGNVGDSFLLFILYVWCGGVGGGGGVGRVDVLYLSLRALLKLSLDVPALAENSTLFDEAVAVRRVGVVA